MIKKFRQAISLFMSMFLILGLGVISHKVYAANQLVHIAVIGDSSTSKGTLLACLEKFARSRSMPAERRDAEGRLIVRNVSDPRGKAPGVFDMEFTIIPGDTWEEQLANPVHRGRLVNDEYHIVLIVFDPNVVGGGSPEEIINVLDNEVVKKIKGFAPKPQLCFVPLRNNLAGDPSGLCGAVSDFSLKCERDYKDPYGYQDFYSVAVLTTDERQVCCLISALCDCEAGRLVLQQSVQHSFSSGVNAPGEVSADPCKAAAYEIRQLLVERGLYNYASIPVIMKVLRELAEKDGLTEKNWVFTVNPWNS